MSDEKPKEIPIKDIISEEGAHELATSPDMQPYLDFMMAEMQGHDTSPHLKTITELPLEKRYVWRVASALKWGFADFDHQNVVTDTHTLNPDDLAKVEEVLSLRPIQFCLFLKALVGAEKMERIMYGAVAMSKRA